MNYTEIYRGMFKTPSFGSTSNTEQPIRFITEHRDEISTALDVGTGRGIILPYLEGLGLEVHCCDLDDFHKQYYPFTVCDLSDPDSQKWLSDQSFDVVTCLDVLEHLEFNAIPGALNALAHAGKFVCITIGNHKDQTHMTVQEPIWWHRQIKAVMPIIEEREYFNTRLLYYACRGFADGSLGAVDREQEHSDTDAEGDLSELCEEQRDLSSFGM